ncbi:MULTISPECIES: hypothetical protein [Streptomyces]|uniref:hypothetical protein n=1 Tax=Streptomyces TaxID=1883 RepID=UPI000D1450D2|nr:MULTISPECIES: hypothetical protein [Streptomyces]
MPLGPARRVVGGRRQRGGRQERAAVTGRRRGDYLGSGYSPGAALLAAGVWHRKELERQFAAEGGC